MRNVVLLSLAGLAFSIAGLLVLLPGCGRDATEVDAREHKAPASPAVGAEVSHWRQTGLGIRRYGIIVEQKDERLSASLYALEDEEGLVIREKESVGKFFPDKQAIIFPLYCPGGVTLEHWLAEGGPHIVVPWAPGASTLSGTLKDTSRTNLYVFARLPSPTQTNGLGVAGIAQ